MSTTGSPCPPISPITATITSLLMKRWKDSALSHSSTTTTKPSPTPKRWWMAPASRADWPSSRNRSPSPQHRDQIRTWRARRCDPRVADEPSAGHVERGVGPVLRRVVGRGHPTARGGRGLASRTSEGGTLSGELERAALARGDGAWPGQPPASGDLTVVAAGSGCGGGAIAAPGLAVADLAISGDVYHRLVVFDGRAGEPAGVVVRGRVGVVRVCRSHLRVGVERDENGEVRSRSRAASFRPGEASLSPRGCR